jgi:hypothetical protein
MRTTISLKQDVEDVLPGIIEDLRLGDRHLDLAELLDRR